MAEKSKRSFNYWQIRTIIVTMVGYALFYFVRKNFSIAMPGLTAEFGILGIFGYASTLISGVGFGFVSQYYGWNAAYITIFATALCGALTLLTMWGAKADGYEIKE